MTIAGRSLAGVALAATLLAGGAAVAHHGWGSYDSSQPLRLDGTIEQASFENPHGTLELRASDKTWHVILAPPSRMRNRGLSAEMLAPGTAATVEGYPHKSDPAEMRAERITIDGRTIELR